MRLALVSSDQECDWYARQAARFGGAALVLGSGDGRVAFALARRGLEVTAVEPSESFFALGETARQEQELEVKLMRADLRSLRLTQSFTAVVAPQNALGLMTNVDEVDALLATVRHHLNAEGGFLFDLRGASVTDAGSYDLFGRQAFLPHLRGRGEKKQAGPIRRLRRHQLDPVQLEASLRHAGLEARERYGDFLGRPWDENDEVQVVVAGCSPKPTARVERP
jgi:SAM-dependent methyltransferase